jgi:hypothetical protein
MDHAPCHAMLIEEAATDTIDYLHLEMQAI